MRRFGLRGFGVLALLGAGLLALALSGNTATRCTPVPVEPVDECPAEAPIGVEACGTPMTCEYGEECCCGECHPSLVCSCDGRGWGCYYTDACLIPHCPGECRTGADCEGGQMCLSPGEPAPCGMCREAEDVCASDADCAPGTVCELWTAGCLCAPANQCLPACHAASDCAAGEVCTDAGHCAPTPCATDRDCPALFACHAGECGRRTCRGDPDCGGGYCVEGACFDTFGRCMYPPP